MILDSLTFRLDLFVKISQLKGSEMMCCVCSDGQMQLRGTAVYVMRVYVKCKRGDYANIVGCVHKYDSSEYITNICNIGRGMENSIYIYRIIYFFRLNLIFMQQNIYKIHHNSL